MSQKPLNFLLVAPRVARKGENYHFPLGLAYVSASLKKAGFNVFTLNLCHIDSSVEIALQSDIREHNIDVVATGGLSCYWNEIEEILEVSRRIDKKIVTIVGGPIVTSEPALCMENLDIDYGVTGEGEESIVELANALQTSLSVENINGLIYRSATGELKETPSRGPILDLDAIPLPDYDGFEFGTLLDTIQNSADRYLEACDKPRPAEVIASRSCPFDCTFCYHPLGRRYRQRSLENFFEEIDYLVAKYSVNVINLLDELFSADKKRLHAFGEKIQGYGMRWAANLRVNDVDESMLRSLKDSGAFLLFFGVESINDDILKSMNKKITRAEIENAFELCKNVGVRANGHLILGDVADTTETMEDSINWMRSHPEYRLTLDFIRAIPDSKIYRYALEKGIIKDKLDHIRNRFPIVNLTNVPNKQFQGIMKRVNEYNRTSAFSLQAKIIKSSPLQVAANSGRFYSIQIQCPLCGSNSEYIRQAIFDAEWKSFICAGCFIQLKAKTIELFKDERGARKELLKNRWLNLAGNAYRENHILRTMWKLLRRVGS